MSGTYYRDHWRDLQDPDYRTRYLEACEEIGFEADLDQIERLARVQGWTDE